ncbi:hypothetical protein B0H13DRAFT_1886890 [Mycena leptocephala]|nr:hypothetical protein B0H13DRAFT_1886890 [Mycena leptocephala]
MDLLVVLGAERRRTTGRRQAIAVDQGIRSGANVDDERRKKAPWTWEEEGAAAVEGDEDKGKTNENEIQVQKPVIRLHTPSPCCIVLRRRKPSRLSVSCRGSAKEGRTNAEVRACTPKAHRKWRGGRGSSPRTRCMREDAWRQDAGPCSSWGRRHWSPSPSWGTNAEARKMSPVVVAEGGGGTLLTGVVVSELQDGSVGRVCGGEGGGRPARAAHGVQDERGWVHEEGRKHNQQPPVCQSSAGSSALDTTGSLSKSEMNGRYTLPSWSSWPLKRVGGERSGRRDRDGNTCVGGELGTCGARFDRSPINSVRDESFLSLQKHHCQSKFGTHDYCSSFGSDMEASPKRHINVPIRGRGMRVKPEIDERGKLGGNKLLAEFEKASDRHLQQNNAANHFPGSAVEGFCLI